MVSPSTHRYRRRVSHLPSMAATALLLAVVGGLGPGFASAASSKLTEPSLVPLDTATLTSNMRHWTKDYAVMFYAPWCQHCREVFLPMWEDVSMHIAEEDPKGKRKLVMGKFDCEQDFVAKSFCGELKLQFYPTFIFFGAGSFHDHDPLSGVVLGPRPTEHDSSAMFPSGALVYHEVMADWIKTMNLVSSSNRFMEKWNPFSGRGKNKASSEERLVEEIEALERKNHQLQQTMAGAGFGAGEQAAEGGAGALPYGYGDTYHELWQVSYDPEVAPVMACVIDLSMQYCDADDNKETDPWCSTLESCVATYFGGDECWPSSCPLQQKGCETTSFCLVPEILEPYLTAYEEHNAAALSDEEGDFFTWPEGSGGTEAEAAADAEQAGVAPGLPPFLGRRPAAGAGGVDRTGDDRRETVAA
ncbi:unnamed protein product [Pylaiella littoralis]